MQQKVHMNTITGPVRTHLSLDRFGPIFCGIFICFGTFPSLRRAASMRPDSLRHQLPEDFGTAAQKEQLKICDSIRSNIQALGFQRNKGVLHRQCQLEVLVNASVVSRSSTLANLVESNKSPTNESSDKKC